ncbi:MAG: outer membrane lipoprotein-sorting protein, partial [Gammaproteobacteria bacterium]
MRNLFAFYFLLLTVVFSTGVVANESENQLDKFLEGLETLTASFEQTLLNEYG